MNFVELSSRFTYEHNNDNVLITFRESSFENLTIKTSQWQYYRSAEALEISHRNYHNHHNDKTK